MQNRNTEEQNFLQDYRMDAYERPSVTADVAIFTIRSTEEETYRHDPENHLSLLLIRRGEHPFKGCWALPGGFLRPDETIEACAFREVTEETNVAPAALMPVGLFSEVGRDPRGWIVSTLFTSVISEDSVKERGGDDAEDAQWFDLSFREEESGICSLRLQNGDTLLEATLRRQGSAFGKTRFEIVEPGAIAFDHAKMIAAALTALRSEARNFDTIFDFLPEKFTLTALQRVQETITGIPILPANFRRKISEYVEETEEYTTGAGHRPAKLYRKKTK